MTSYLCSLARDTARGPKNRGIMLAAAKEEILRARTILLDSHITLDPHTPCDLCKVKREEYVEKQQGKAKSKQDPGPLVKVMRMRLVRCNNCKQARGQFKGFSCKRDLQLVEMAEQMGGECRSYTEADDDDLATKVGTQVCFLHVLISYHRYSLPHSCRRRS